MITRRRPCGSSRGVSYSKTSRSRSLRTYGVLMGRPVPARRPSWRHLRSAAGGPRPIVLPIGVATDLRPSERTSATCRKTPCCSHADRSGKTWRLPSTSGAAPAQMDRRVRELAALLDLERLSATLAAGPQRRRAAARGAGTRVEPSALSVLCLDEPLSALDQATREQMVHAVAAVRSRQA